MKALPSSPEEDMFSCKSYVKHSESLANIYARENKNLANAFNRPTVINLQKSKILVKRFAEAQGAKMQKCENAKIFLGYKLF